MSTDPKTLGGYVYDPSWSEERRRLALIEHNWDPATTARLESLGVGPGWHCADIGAGGGSIARWLRDRVGETGRVVACDLDTRFLEAEDGIDVRTLNILTDELEPGAYDLVHCRCLLHHLPGEQRTAVSRMVHALRPGGVLLATEPYLGAMYATTTPALAAMWRAFDLATPNTDFLWAPRVIGTLAEAGLTEIGASAVADVVRGGTPGAEVIALTVEAVRSRIAPGADIDAGLDLLMSPTTIEPGLVWYSAWGRRSAS